ncbi:MAG: YhcN/YlaJ family sporulation lipoprotein [Clostridia bacterium]|nr:YhcN/YlaJ family sporulation lipoprotein [Clostridia bacterium]
MKKTLLILMLTLLSAVMLTGCASNADTLASPTPGATNMMDNLLPGTGTATESPMTDNATMQPDGTAAPVATIEDTRKNVQAMEEALEKLSEVDDAYVITLGDTALVGLEFEKQYQGGTDERLKKMVLARLQTVDKNIAKVAVTSDEPLVTSIEALTEVLKSASSLEDVNRRAEEVLKQLTVYGG